MTQKFVTKHHLDQAREWIELEMMRRVGKFGTEPDTTRHETLGILTEEWTETCNAIRLDDNKEGFALEMSQLAGVAVYGVASMIAREEIMGNAKPVHISEQDEEAWNSAVIGSRLEGRGIVALTDRCVLATLERKTNVSMARVEIDRRSPGSTPLEIERKIKCQDKPGGTVLVDAIAPSIFKENAAWDASVELVISWSARFKHSKTNRPVLIAIAKENLAMAKEIGGTAIYA